MNALLPMGVQIPDFARTFALGREGYRQDQEAQNQNALRAAMQQYGPAAMQGDQNALSEIARYDPKFSMDLMGSQQDMEMQRRSDARADTSMRHGMRIDNERLELARQEAQQSAAEHAARMSAVEREQAAAEVGQIASAATMAWQKGPQEFQRFMGSFGDQMPENLRGLSYEDAPYAIAAATGMVEGFQAPAPTSATQTLQERAQLGGLQPGTPEYNEFMLAGPVQRTQEMSPSFRQLTQDELAAGQYPIGSQIDQKTGRIYPAETRGTLTEGERRAGGFLSRMEAAETIIQGLDASGTQRIGYGEAMLNAIPGVPEGLALGQESEKLLQAQRDWVRSKLRMESGAVIGDEEMRDEIKTYFPQRGEGPEVIRQKAQARQEAIEAMRGMAGRSVDGQSQTNPPATPAPEVPQELMQQLQSAPAGTKIKAPDGRMFEWDGSALVPTS